MTKIQTNKIVAGEIFDASGHTDFTGSIDEAMGIIMDSVKHAGKWAYINGAPFIFESYDAAEENQVRDLLASSNEPHFLLTGKVQGGATKTAAKGKTLYRGSITSKPISQILTGKTRAQLAVSIRQEHGKEVVDVFITSFNGARTKLQKHKKTILSAIYNGLRPDSELKKAAKTQAKAVK